MELWTGHDLDGDGGHDIYSRHKLPANWSGLDAESLGGCLVIAIGFVLLLWVVMVITESRERRQKEGEEAAIESSNQARSAVIARGNMILGRAQVSLEQRGWEVTYTDAILSEGNEHVRLHMVGIPPSMSSRTEYELIFMPDIRAWQCGNRIILSSDPIHDRNYAEMREAIKASIAEIDPEAAWLRH